LVEIIKFGKGFLEVKEGKLDLIKEPQEKILKPVEFIKLDVVDLGEFAVE
jgi:hypothetical protein